MEAGLLLGVAALPSAWRVLDAGLVAVLTGMLLALTAATYALHAVTFDCFLLTSHRARRQFSYTQRKE